MAVNPAIQPVASSKKHIPKYASSGSVYSYAFDETSGITYLGGNFRAIWNTNTANGISKVSGSTVNSKFYSGTPPYKMISDGSGNYYLGFSSAGSVQKINSSGVVDSTFNLTLNGTVQVLYLNGTTLYVGGSFTLANGVTRDRLVAVDSTTGSVLSFDVGGFGASPYAPAVYALAVSGSSLIIGGFFSTIGSSANSSPGLATVNATTGSWLGTTSPSTVSSLGTVRSLVVSGDTVYVGGAFTTASGLASSRVNVAAFTISTGALTSFNPTVSASGGVTYMALGGTVLYVAGAGITQVSSVARAGLAAIDISSGLTSFNPTLSLTGGSSASFSPSALFVVGSTLYVATINLNSMMKPSGYSASSLFGFDTSTGAVTYAPKVYAVYNALYDGTNVVVSCTSTNTDYAERYLIGAVYSDGSIVSSFYPTVDAVPYFFLVNSTLYMGWQDASSGGYINGSLRPGLGSVDGVTGSLSSFNANTYQDDGNGGYWRGTTYSVAYDSTNNALHIVGVMSTFAITYTLAGHVIVNATTGSYIASTQFYDSNGSQNATMTKVLISGNSVYVCGYFDTVNGNTTFPHGVYIYDKTTRVWANPLTNVGYDGYGYTAGVQDAYVIGNSLYIIVNSTQVNGVTCNGVAVINATTGLGATSVPVVVSSGSTNWYSIAVNGTDVYLYGGFTGLNSDGKTYAGVAIVNSITGASKYYPASTRLSASTGIVKSTSAGSYFNPVTNGFMTVGANGNDFRIWDTRYNAPRI